MLRNCKLCHLPITKPSLLWSVPFGNIHWPAAGESSLAKDNHTRSYLHHKHCPGCPTPLARLSDQCSGLGTSSAPHLLTAPADPGGVIYPKPSTRIPRRPHPRRPHLRRWPAPLSCQRRVLEF